MKTDLILRTGIVPVTAAILLLSGCNKSENPPIKSFPAADFDISITETRQSHDFVYTFDRGTKALAINPDEQKLQELWITQWNEVTLSLKGKDAAFEGANVSSGNPSCVRVNRIDSQTCSLEYVADGSAEITVWNSDTFSYSFTVYAKDVIEPEYLLVTIGDKEFKCKFRDYTKYENWKKTNPNVLYRTIRTFGWLEDTCRFSLNTIRLGYERVTPGLRPGGNIIPKRVRYNETGLGDAKDYIDQPVKVNETGYCFYDLLENYPKDGKLLEIKGLYPENSSWRHISKIECVGTGQNDMTMQADYADNRGWTGYSLYTDNEKYGIPTFMKGGSETDLDFSEFQGRKAYMTRWWNYTSYTYPDKPEIARFDHFVDIVIYSNYGTLQPDIKQAKKIYAYIACWPEDDAYLSTDYKGIKYAI